MSDDVEFAPPPLAPGADDPRSPVHVADVAAPKPLGPGDDDPRSPAKSTALAATTPLGPGESTDEDSGLEMFAPPPAGPGDAAQTPRHVTHAPKRQPTLATSAIAVAPVSDEEAAAPADDALIADSTEKAG